MFSMLVFREIAQFSDDEIKALEKLQYMEITDMFEKIFFVTQAEVDQYYCQYEAILPYCKKFTTNDGISLFAAKIIRLYYQFEKGIYMYFYKYSNEINPKFADITIKSGWYVRWVNFEDVKKEWQIPFVGKGSRLFYNVVN